MLSRRALLGLGAAGGLAAGLAAYGFSRTSWAASTRPLRIPTLLEGKPQNGVQQYDLSLGQHTSTFFDGVNTPTFGINGNYLGPTVKLKAGSHVSMNVTNKLGRPSTLHWHGMHLPAKADGGPHQIIADGATWHSRFQVKQPASTLWYHSHLAPRTGFQVYHGLAGMVIIEDEKAADLGLPQDYGVDDIPLVLQDRRFADDGAFDYLSSMPDRMMGMKGDVLLVNGTVNPFFVAKTDTLRLRILNGSNARFYVLKFSDGRAFHQIASDGGLLGAPFKTDAIMLAPAERAEIVVDLSDGRPVSLVSAPPAGQGMMGRGRGMMMDMMMGGNQRFKVLEIRPDQTRKKLINLPQKMAYLARPDARQAVRTRRFTLSMGMMGGGMGRGMMGGGAMTINGKSMEMNRIDETVKVGTTEIWEIDNPTMLAHPFHIHDVQFRILDRNGTLPGLGERGLKDTVVVNPGERVRVLLSFADYTDATSPYMYHCHILEHEDAGMMGQFVVVA